MKPILFIIFLAILASEVFATIRFSDITADKGELILGVEVGARLYVASNDDINLLKNLKITNNGEVKTALDIINLGRNTDGTAIGWEAKGTITIQSSTVTQDAERMTGFLYFTTYTQAQDPNFLVYYVDRQISISYDIDDLTLVFLNLNLNLRTANSPLYIPQKSSQVSSLSSLPTSILNIYWNEPVETYKNPDADYSKQQRIFSNPLRIAPDWQYFESVEPFQIFNDVWYIRSDGRIRFDVRPKWDDPNGSTTSSVSTTGLLMCSFAPENLKINLMTNPANAASSGLFVSYNLINSVVLKMDGFIRQIDSKNDIRNELEGVWDSSQSTYLSIQSNYSVAGRYAVQYFQLEGVVLPTIPTTIGPSTTPNSMETTTTPSRLSTTTKGVSRSYGGSILSIFLALFFLV